ncbi:MAG: aldo/keto reductase [Clostridia bacterium]|nr:aldo/keto reductase [Clostridia bacterium]
MNKLGFGFLRLPRLNPEDEKSTDYELLNSMVDAYLASGHNYFDTAYTYLDGESENAIKKAVIERHPRESVWITDKLPGYTAKSEDDNERFFKESLERTGAGYFDLYLVHGIDEEGYEKAKNFHQFDYIRKLKEEGKVKHIGFSFHDNAKLLRTILTEQPGMEYVQLQINYLDWESESVQSRKCFEVAKEFGIPVLVMEPVKGGTLANIPEKAKEALDGVTPGISPSKWAMRFVQQLPEVAVCLSGMNTMEQLEENLEDLQPLTEAESNAIAKAARIITKSVAIPCTGCGYCLTGCQIDMPIPTYFKLYNEYKIKPDDKWKVEPEYQKASIGHAKASMCLQCGGCASVCPQHLPITDYLMDVAEVFEGGMKPVVGIHGALKDVME